MLVAAIVAFLGGAFTILSPCILPVIPFAFARTIDRSRAEIVSMLAGLAAAFTLAVWIGAAGIGWLLTVEGIGRIGSLILLAGLGIALLTPVVFDRLARPAVALGARLLQRVDHRQAPAAQPRRHGGVAASALVGFAIGLLWAPCAGPILGLLVTQAVRMPGLNAALPVASFAIGAACVLGVAIAGGARAMRFLRHAGLADRAVRRVLGTAVLGTVILLASGADRRVFARAGIASTDRVESALLARSTPARDDGAPRANAGTSSSAVAVTDAFKPARPIHLPALTGPMPELAGATEWINSAPLTRDSLRGKVVLIDFWTFQCYNCLNALPHVKELYAKYRDRGFVVIGVHTPELPQERVLENVRREVRRLGISYPVVVDNDYRIWNAFHNQYWPAAYYVDAAGESRYYHFGEGAYEEQDSAVESLLKEAGSARKAPTPKP